LHPLDSGELSFDANSIVDFAKTARLPLLDRLFESRALVSDFVVNELAAASIEWKRAQVVVLKAESELQLFEDIRRNNPPLGAGEVGAITVASLRRAGLITNDRQARRAASELGIPVSGSLAILRYAVEVGTLTGEEAVRLLSEMIVAGAWLSEELVDSFRRDVLKRQ
jgi:predicted nucleic acid-binding protein